MPGRRLKGHAEGGWCTFHDVPGWESFTVTVRAAVVAGHVKVVALRVELVDGVQPEGLTAARLRSLPMAELAAIGLSATHTRRAPELHAAMRKATRPESVKHDPRAAVTVEQVAAVWNSAYSQGRPPRAAVVGVLTIGARTADRYIARAREAGLIPEASTGRPRKSTPGGKAARVTERKSRQ